MNPTHNFTLINCDTDAIMIAKSDQTEFSEQEQEYLLKELNSLYPELIKFEDDGYFEKVIVIKAKNYILKEHGTGKVSTKGSATKDSKKEPQLRKMIDELVNSILKNNINYSNLIAIYNSYVYQVINGVQDIKPWCSKKTITEKILDCKGWQSKIIQVRNKKGELRDKTVYYSKKSDNLRKNEIDVWEAIKDSEDIQEGNKCYLYPVKLPDTIITGRVSEKTGKPLKDEIKSNNGLRLAENWKPCDEDSNKLLARIYATVKILKTILDIENNFQDYSKLS